MINKRGVVVVVMLLMLVLPMVNAVPGVGIKTGRESLLVDEAQEVCIRDYSVYNPWPDEAYVTVNVSDDLSKVLQVKEMVPIFVPANTGSDDSIPVEFCFKIPEVYERDCWVGNSLFCEKTCSEPQKTFEGDIVVRSVSSPTAVTGSGGSATQLAVSQPLKLKVNCQAYERRYTAAYVALAIISLIVMIYLIWQRNRKPASIRKKEKMLKLKAEMKKLKSGK